MPHLSKKIIQIIYTSFQYLIGLINNLVFASCSVLFGNTAMQRSIHFLDYTRKYLPLYFSLPVSYAVFRC